MSNTTRKTRKLLKTHAQKGAQQARKTLQERKSQEWKSLNALHTQERKLLQAKKELNKQSLLTHEILRKGKKNNYGKKEREILMKQLRTEDKARKAYNNQNSLTKKKWIDFKMKKHSTNRAKKEYERQSINKK